MDLARIFTSAGVPFVEVGDWRSRVRPGTFTPEGVLVHHTATTGFDGTLKVARDGREDLNGPLYNVLVAKGRCYLLSAGRANHAGTGAAEALANLRVGRVPKGTARQMGYADDPGTVGNGLLVGFGVLSPGKPSVDLAQEDWVVVAKASAAILRYLKRPTVARVIGHAEWTRRKVDPEFGRGPGAHLNMERMRQAVRPYLIPKR